MSIRFDDLLAMAAVDGASAPIGVLPARNGVDVDQVLDAWYIERQNHIETALFLDQARQLLTRILLDDEVTDATRRKSRTLLKAIKDTQPKPRRPRGF